MGSQRIRFDACCTMPEMMNNNIRQTRAYYPDGAANVRAIPTNFPYLESLNCSGNQLTSLDVSRLDISSLEKAGGIFQCCKDERKLTGMMAGMMAGGRLLSETEKRENQA